MMRSRVILRNNQDINIILSQEQDCPGTCYS